MTRDYSLFVKDILEAINYIEKFVGKTAEEQTVEKSSNKALYAFFFPLMMESFFIIRKMNHGKNNG